jgi:hypothetical protein
MVRPKAGSRLAVARREALALGAELPHLVEILAAIGLERDKGPGVGDAGQPRQASGYHLGQFFDLAHPDDGDDVGVASYRVGLRDPLDGRDLLCQFGNAGWLSVYQDKGSNHSPNVALTALAARDRARSLTVPF